ncbi:putative pentatricopeptide repeat-containing protein At3g15200 isoform X1 [Corylus avellana]|uniref:putative pentatricopeptide repeat-containing protein At3g15200 isoform X1 n=1 Tax=Corylus avellana TaxID=13451 RepID=UPI00286B4DAC|nr:putative pentatricopeptide repeat-containing protein At3g15200 isoform X1 [Corylus avellana]
MLSTQRLITFSRENIKRKFKLKFQTQARKDRSHHPISLKALSSLANILNSHSPKNPNSGTFTKRSQFHFPGRTETTRFLHSVADSHEPTEFRQDPDDQSAIYVQNLLKFRRDKPAEAIERALDLCGLRLTEDLVLSVLQRHRSDWRPAYVFFNWVCRKGEGSGYSPGSGVYNEILDVLGKLQRFEEMIQVLDKMSKRKGLVNNETYEILLNRFAAAHKVEEAIDIFNKRKQFGLESDLVALQRLLMWLCRYKHVEVAETIFHSKRNEFGCDVKTWNIILNGWCILGNVFEAKRFWKEIIASKCKTDMFTYGTFINALTKKGKLGTAVKLFRAMQENDLKPDVVICNCIIDALCFKKRIPEALEVFKEMKERGYPPNATTYNSLIKHLCKIRRMEKVYELLDEMEQKKGSCLPNDITCNYLLKTLKKPEEVPVLLERMQRNGCKMTSDTHNLILKLYMDWGDQERVRYTWEEMERNGLGHDRRSYTIMIHGFYDNGRIQDALRYFSEMTSKGMVPEPRTKILVIDMNMKLKESRRTRGKNEESSIILHVLR